MKGVSTVIVMILILLISVALTGLGYLFFTEVLTSVTTAGEESISQSVTSMLSQMRIESLTAGTPGNIYIRNTGKVNLTDFTVYVNDGLEVPSTPLPSLAPGSVGTIGMPSLSSGQIVKVTAAQGATARESVP
jgi:hypothetical protein